MTDYFSNRKEGPKANTTGVSITGKGEEATAFESKKKSASRAARSYMGYHCRAQAYRPSCRMAFKLWGQALRFTELHLRRRRLQRMQAEQSEQFRRIQLAKLTPMARGALRENRIPS